LRKVFLILNRGLRPLKIRVFVANIANEFILGLDILRVYDTSVDLRRQTLRLAEEEVSLWSLGAGPRPSSLAVARGQVIPAKCEGILMARLESPLGVESDLVEQTPKAHSPKGIYIAGTFVRDRREVPLRALNATHRDQVLTRGFPLARASHSCDSPVQSAKSRNDEVRSGASEGPGGGGRSENFWNNK
jgi:hypothetical protein